MAHNIETMAYAGEVPWHGLGVKVGADLTPQEMLKQANLDWTVSKRSILTYNNADSEKADDLIISDDYSVLVRDSDNSILGPCGPKFIPTQNADAFTFFKKFTEAGDMNMHTAGSLRGGRQVWGLAEINDGFTLPGDDRIEGYLLVSVSHEWGKSNEIRFTPIRVVCNNTLSMALADRSQPAFKMPHTKAFDEDLIVSAEKALGLASTRLDEYQESAEFLSSKQYNENKVVSYIADVMQPKLAMQEKILLESAKTSETKAIETRLETLEKLQRTPYKVYEALEQQPGANLKSSKGTWWGAVNAVTYVVDHKWGHDRDAAMHNAWFGARASLKNRAMTKAIEYAQAA
jgi:phage/plasmid-like protein (TIGR03299 family)|tara:strand:+ start:374 stop:1411 length:1038 start_codon:yes stop_codon:yes gene_type:complete